MIHRTRSSGLALALALGLVACGPGEPEEGMEEVPEAPGQPTTPPTDTGQPPAGAAEMPSWFRVSGNQVEMDVVAGATPAGNYWNFNGARNGEMTITVPQGAQVTLRFRNDDPAMVHSIGVAQHTGAPPPQPATDPVFSGAITPDAGSPTDATKTGEMETITFTADRPGEYALYCYVPGHAAAGMWVRFNVGGTAGVTGAPPGVTITM
jgi:FtsP/CotA-like multicopper oxidase with cupredoxin domain